MLSGVREAGCFREVAALHSDHLRQVPLYYFIHVAAAVQSGAGLLSTGLVKKITDHKGVEVTCVELTSLTVWV